jgi:4-oxalocrotonate tautomerase
MPTFRIEMFEGRSPQQKHDLVAAITRETCRVLGCDAASVDIIIVDVKRENWATAGTLWSEKGS